MADDRCEYAERDILDFAGVEASHYQIKKREHTGANFCNFAQIACAKCGWSRANTDHGTGVAAAAQGCGSAHGALAFAFGMAEQFGRRLGAIRAPCMRHDPAQFSRWLERSRNREQGRAVSRNYT